MPPYLSSYSKKFWYFNYIKFRKVCMYIAFICVYKLVCGSVRRSVHFANPYCYIYIYIYIQISLNIIDIFCLHIFLLILSYCHKPNQPTKQSLSLSIFIFVSRPKITSRLPWFIEIERKTNKKGESYTDMTRPREIYTIGRQKDIVTYIYIYR